MEDVGIRCYQRTIERVVAWVANAATYTPMMEVFTRVWLTLLNDWHQKKQQISTANRIWPDCWLPRTNISKPTWQLFPRHRTILTRVQLVLRQ